LAAGRRQVPAGDSVSVGRAPPSRGREGTQPGRVSCVWNVETPSGSGRWSRFGWPTVREAQFPGGTGWSKKPTPVGRKATGRWDIMSGSPAGSRQSAGLSGSWAGDAEKGQDAGGVAGVAAQGGGDVAVAVGVQDGDGEVA